MDPDAPSAPVIDGPTWGRIKKTYKFTFNSASPLGRDVYYFIDWGDRSGTKWAGPYASGEEVNLAHVWSIMGTHNIKARARDSENLWGPWSEYEVITPRDRATISSFFIRFLKQFPKLQKIPNFLTIYN